MDTTIVRAAIHPAIGIARVGDSNDEYFLGPEVVGAQPVPSGAYKDATGALKRQAARFRIYGYNAAGELVRELTDADSEITWTVHVANAKAAWYQFQIALDIPEAADATPSALRNATITGDARAALVIDPGPRTIVGTDTSGPAYAFDTGEFMGTPVYLGELRTDEAGRLLVLGGRGVSASYDGSPATTFANNDKWHDDVSDGPVTADVVVGGRRVPVDPAWVVTAPPNYAPDVIGVRTMYDLILDAFVSADRLPFPEQVSFTEHIEPILARLCNLQWVNQGFAASYGWGGREEFFDPAYLARLSSTAERDEEVRRQVFIAFRVWSRDASSPIPWPWLYGDAMSIPPISPRQLVMLANTQYRLLALWADGTFVPPDGSAPRPRSLDDVPVPDQPATLDRTALTYCLADAFHPGCEITWPMRHLTMYQAPFRILHRRPDDPEPPYPAVLTPAVALAPGGPLAGQTPGSLTRWMAVPWQTDSASCRSGYEARSDPRYDPYLPTF
ncbi:MAG: LodA/GoxA family CTQ-dependent oxidase, partial [Acidimicrobiales bacterium]